ncbi:MAG: tRNA 2-thiouridine(34) synthase MnmA [Coriobacteriales bacterium]|jgi:tRNA-specific 2-thiouridylase|nr:tRNA 2-thiouridine(34) synthase MnmA [Coriobacteriales bacterium]
MSGGVDSSVAAHLLIEAGYDCTGATMRLIDDDLAGQAGERAPESGCCSLADVEDARAVCARLGIPHYTLNFAAEFTRRVIEPFVSAYQRGETPNPCIDCNRFLKFEHLLARALTLGYDYIATGHYARIRRGAQGRQEPQERQESPGRQEEKYHLLRGVDSNKDQSYVLYALTQAQLAHTLLPLGDLTKAEVRSIATRLGLQTAEKPESQDICFVSEGDYRSFIGRFTKQAACPGPIVDNVGQRIGMHQGLAAYTVGQRKGLGVAMGHPLYVQRIDVANNTLVVGGAEGLYAQGACIRDMNMIVYEHIDEPLRVTAKHRYRGLEQAAQLSLLVGGRAEVLFDELQKAITPGQALVCYQGDEVVGGGVITTTTLFGCRLFQRAPDCSSGAF